MNNVKVEIGELSSFDYGRIGDEDPAVPLSVLYEYGKISLLHQGASIDVPPLNFGFTTFTGKDDIWGISLKWVKDLVANHLFVFIFQFEMLPDLILADNNILWSRSGSTASGGRTVLPYVPANDGPVKLIFLKDKRYRDPLGSEGGIKFGAFSGCLKKGPAKSIAYQQYDLPTSVVETPVPAILTNRDYFQELLLESDMTPFEKPAYKTMDVKILHETVEAYLPNLAAYIEHPSKEQIQRLIDTIPILEANGVDGMALYHLTDPLLEALADSKLRSFIVPTCSAGEWWGPYGSDDHICRPNYALGLDICNRLLDRMEDCRVYIWFAEIDDRRYDLLKSPELKVKMAQIFFGLGTVRYDDITDNEFWREAVFAEGNREWKKELWKKINDPKRVVAVYQASSPLTVDKFKNAGADMTVNKAIFRGCMNATVAAGRGTCKAHHQPHGFDYDPWSWKFRMNHHPDEWLQGLLVYLHAGCSFLFHEGTLFRRDTDGRIKPTETGVSFCKASRYARQHPAVGKQIVKIAAIHGGGGEYAHMPQPHFRPQVPTDINPPDWIPLGFSDYKLLNVFFPMIGGPLHGHFDRLMTGTPYGPMDIIPADIQADDMKDYDFIFVLGTNGCDEKQMENFCQYVENGGKVVIALGQLRAPGIEPRKILTGDLKKFAGISVDIDTNKIKLQGAQVLSQFPDGSMFLHHKIGKGEVYLFTTNALTTLGEELPRKLLQKLGSESSFLNIEPFSDYIEIMANRKNQTISLCLFNHGQIGFPSGNGPKLPPWQGILNIKVKKLGFVGNIAVRRVEFGCRFVEVPFNLIDGILSYNGIVDRFAEWVIGSEKTIEDDWFGKF